MLNYILALLAFSGVLLLGCYIAFTQLVHSLLARHNIRLEKIRFLSLCNLSYSFPKSARLDPSQPLVHLTVARLGVRIHRWGRPLGNAYVKPLEFYLKEVTVKVFRPPPSRHTAAPTTFNANGTSETSPPQTKEDSTRPRYSSREDFGPAPVGDSLLFGLFRISKNNLLVRLARAIVENVCLIITDAEVIVDDQVQVALDSVMLYSSVFDLSNPDEQRRQQRLYPLAFSALHSFSNFDNTNSLRYVVMLSLSGFDSALVPSKARKRRKLVHQFRGNGIATLSVDIHFTPHLRVHNVHWDTQLETLDLFLRPAIHAFYKLRRSPMQGGPNSSPTVPKFPSDLGALFRLPVRLLRSLNYPMAHWFPKQVDVSASLRQLNVYFSLPTEHKSYSSSSEAPTRERQHTGILRLTVKTLSLLTRIPDLSAREVHVVIDLRCKHATVAVLKQCPSGMVAQDSSRHRRLFGMQGLHLHVNGELTSDAPDPEDESPRPSGPGLDSSFPDHARVPPQPPYSGNASVPSMASSTGSSAFFGKSPQDYIPPTRFAAQIKTKLTINNPFVDVCLDDLVLWENFVRHVRQTRYAANKSERVLQSNVSGYTRRNLGTSQHPQGALPDRSPVLNLMAQSPLYSLGYALQETGPPADTIGYVIPSVIMELHIINPVIKLRTPPPETTADPGTGVFNRPSSPGTDSNSMWHSPLASEGNLMAHGPREYGPRGSNCNDILGRTNCGTHTGRPSLSSSTSDSRLLVLALETNSIYFVSKLHRKAPHKIRAQGIPLPPSGASPFLLSLFSRLTVDPLKVHLAPSLYFQHNLVIPGVPPALVFTPLATVEDLFIENRTVIDVSPFLQSLQPSVPPQSIGLGIWHSGLGIPFPDHHSTLGHRPTTSLERTTFSVLTCESSVRTSKIRARFTQQQQQWLTWMLPQVQALRERLIMLARAKLPRQHFGSGTMLDSERESSPYTYGSYSGANTRSTTTGDLHPQTGYGQGRISNRVKVHYLKYSLVLPDVRVEASLSNHVLGLPYRGKNEQFSVHDFVLQFHDIQSSLAWSLDVGKGTDPGAKSDASNLSASPEFPTNSSHLPGTSHSPKGLSPPSRSIRSFGQSPLASSKHPPLGGSLPEHPMHANDPDDWLHSLGLQAWTLEGSCRYVRGFIVTLPTGSASPPPSPRRLAQGLDSGLSFQPSSPQPFMERVLFLENVRFSTKKTYYVADVASSPESQELGLAGIGLTGMENQRGADEPARTTLLTDPIEGVPAVTATVATNIDLDALHIEYSMSRAYLFILLWVRLKQMAHFLEIDRLTICKMTSDEADITTQESTSPFLYPTPYRNILNPAEKLVGKKRPGSPSLGLRTGGPLGDSPFWRNTSGTHRRIPSLSSAASVERPVSHLLDALPYLRSDGTELLPSGSTQSSSSTAHSYPTRLATTYTFAMSGAVVSGSLWLPFGCNEFNEDEMAEYLYKHVGQDRLHRLRLLANQVIVLYSRYNGGYTVSDLDSGSHNTGNEADIQPARAPKAHSEPTYSDRFSEQKLTEEPGKESPPKLTSSHVSDWLVTLQSLQLLGRKTIWHDEDVVGADPGLKSAASRPTSTQSMSNVGVKDIDGPRWQPWDRNLEGSIEKGWDNITYLTLKETPEEVTIVALESAMIRPTTPFPLISTLNIHTLSPKSSSTKEPQRATDMGPGHQSEGQRHTSNDPSTFNERQESSVRWTMDPAALASAQSPQEFMEALTQGHLENMGGSPLDSPATPTKDTSGSGLRAAVVDPNDPPLENATQDPICASFGVEIDCQALRFRLPYGYNIAFSIDNVNNLVKGSRNLVHYVQQELPATLVRSNFDRITSQLMYTSVDAALFCMTMHPGFALIPTPTWSGVPGGDELLATLPRADGPDTGPRHASAAPLASTLPWNLKEARRRVHTLHRIQTQALLVSEKEWHMAWPKPVTHPKKLPYFIIQVRKLSFVVDDDPFETALGRIYRCGLVEQQARLARSAAFRKTASNLQGGDDQKSVPENPSTANVDIDAAQERLHQYNSANWIRLIRATMSHPRDHSDEDKKGPRRKILPFGRTKSLMSETIHSDNLNNIECQYPTYVYSPSGPTAQQLPPHGELPSKDKPPLVRAHRRRYTPSSWTHPSIALTDLTIHNFTATLGPPPTVRTMHDTAAFIRHTDGCTPVDYLYDILIPLRLHLRMGDTRVTLRNYPLPLLHIPDITKLLSSLWHRGPSSLSGRGGSESRGSRGPLVSILSNKRLGPVTRDRMQHEKYLKQGMLGSMGEPPPFSGGFQSQDAYLRQASYWLASNYAQHRGWAPIDGIQGNSGIVSDRSSMLAIEQGGAWEVKGDIIIAEALSGEESVRVIWAPLVLDGVELCGGQQQASLTGALKRGPEPKIGYVRIHRTVPPPKFFCKLNIRIHTAPRAHSSSQHQHIHLYATPKVNGQSASGKSSSNVRSLYRPPVQLVWDQSVQPCITALSQRVENVTSTSVDPSPPIAWWDKMRMLMHGSVRLRLVEPLAFGADYNGSVMDPREESGQMETLLTGYDNERPPGFGGSSLPASARSPRVRGKHPSPPTGHRRQSMRTFTGPGELWLLMRGSRDPYALGNKHVGFLTIWRGNVQIQIGQIQKTRSSAPPSAGATYSNRAGHKSGRTNHDTTSRPGQGGEPRRSRSMSAIIENHDMMVQDVIQICSQEFLFAVPILRENTPSGDNSPDSTNGEPRSAGAVATANPRVRFVFLPSYRLTKQNKSENGHHQADLAYSELLGYAETIHPSPLLRFEKLLLYLSGGVNFTLGMGFGVNLNVLRQLDTYSKWLFSPTPWLSSHVRTQGGVLLDDSQSVYEDLPTAASFTSGLGSTSGLDRNLEPRSTRSSQTSRRTHPVRHYELIMRVPKFATPPFGQTAYDTYLGFRSDHVHMSISLRCSYDAYQRALETPISGMAPTYSSSVNPEAKNFIALSTNTINHIMGFTSLFASKMLLPICRGNLFPEVSVKDLKFGKFLKSVKCRLDVANLDLSYSQHLERAESNLDVFKEYLSGGKAVNLEEALLVHGQVMEAKSRVGSMDLQLLAIQQSKVLTVDAVKGTVYPIDHAGRGPGAVAERKLPGDAPSSTLGSEHGGTSSNGSGLRQIHSQESLSGPPSCKSDSSHASVPRSTTQVIARQWVIDDCILELTHIDIRMVQADFHIFSQSVPVSLGIPLERFHGLRLLPRDLERHPRENRGYLNVENFQDLGETNLHDAILSNLSVEPLLFSPRIMYYRQPQGKMDDDPNYYAIALYQNLDHQHSLHQNNAVHRRDSRAIQISLLATRLERVVQEIAIQRERQQEMEDYMLNADQAQELVALQTLERVRITCMELEEKRHSIERTMQKLHNSQMSTPLMRVATELDFSARHHPTSSDPQSPHQHTESSEPSEDSYAAMFKHRFLVHSGYAIWNTWVRDILMKFLYVEESQRALRYFLSMAATKVVRDLSSEENKEVETTDTALEEFNDDTVDSQKGNDTDIGQPPSVTNNWHFATNPQDNSPPTDHGPHSPPTTEGKGISGSQFMQLVRPRKPGRRGMVLNRATTEQYIEYLLQGATDATVEAQAIHTSPTESSGSQPTGPTTADSKQRGKTPQGESFRPSSEPTESDRAAEDASETDFGLLEDLAEYFIVNSIYVEFLNPQVNAALTRDSENAVILAAERIQIKRLALFDEETAEKDVTNPQDDNEHLVKTRSLFGFEKVQVYAVQKKNVQDKPQFYADSNYGAQDSHLWPMWVPMELLLDESDQTLDFLEPLVQKTSGLLIYDKANTVRIQANYSDLGLDDRANFVGLHFPELVITADSRQYSSLFTIIYDVLIYGEPLKKKHRDQLNTLTLAANITDFTGALLNVEFMQASIRKRRELLQQQPFPSTSFAPLTDIRSYRENHLEYLALVEKLRITMEVVTNVQKQRLGRQQRYETQGRKVVSRRTSLRIDRILLSMLLTPEQPLCDWHLRTVTFMAASHSDQSVSYAVDINQALITNRLPDPYFYELLAPYTDELAGTVDFSRQKMIRLRLSELAPVGGIAVVEHLEISLFPLRIQMTYEVGKKLIQYLFPDRDKPGGSPSNQVGGTQGDSNYGKADNKSHLSDRDSTHHIATSVSSRPRSVRTTASGNSNGRRSQPGRPGSVRSRGTLHDDRSVMEMKSRASKNKTFLYITLPGARHCLSYQGQKGKNLEDLHGFVFTFPTFEYHNETWSWLELLTQVKKDAIRVALAHTGSLVREKIRQIRGPRHQHMISGYAESIADYSSTSSGNAGHPNQLLETGRTPTARRQSIAHPSPGGSFLGLVMSPKGGGRPESTSVARRKRSQSVHHAIQSPGCDGAKLPAESNTQRQSPTSFTPNAVATSDNKESEPKPKPRLANPLAAVTMFARKLSKTHHTFALDKASSPVAPSEGLDNGLDDDTVAESPVTVENGGTTVHVLSETHGQERPPSPPPFPSDRRQSVRSHISGRRRVPLFWESSSKDQHHRSGKRDKETEEKAQLLFGSHYAASKK
ncbi:Protein SABRE [Dispira simplex]|nr:Protein SABRE [Dispira simplex]